MLIYFPRPVIYNHIGGVMVSVIVSKIGVTVFQWSRLLFQWA